MAAFLLSIFQVYLCYAVLSFPCIIVVTSWERADLLAPPLYFLVVMQISHILFRLGYST